MNRAGWTAGWTAEWAAEFTKARTERGAVWLPVALVATAVGVSAAVAALTPHPVDPVRTALSGVLVGQVFAALVGVRLVGGEYASGMIGVTLAALPDRRRVLAAKAAVGCVLVGPAAALAVGGSLLAGWLLLDLHASAAAMLRAAAGSVLWLLLTALLALGITFAVREATVSTGVVLGVLFVLPVLPGLVGDEHLRHHVEQWTPLTAGQSVQATAGLRGLPIAPWPGLGVLAAWSAAALVAGGLVLYRRDA